jgi:Holliday junction resolvase RusA-like endonuclease
MDPITCVIHGKPFGKQRPKFSRKFGRAYTPAETVRFETHVAQVAAENFPAPLTGPVRITVSAEFEPSASWSKRKKAEHMGRAHVQKPDLDNIVKAISDGLNRVAFADDSQIAEMVIQKRWGVEAKTIVMVEAI